MATMLIQRPKVIFCEGCGRPTSEPASAPGPQGGRICVECYDPAPIVMEQVDKRLWEAALWCVQALRKYGNAANWGPASGSSSEVERKLRRWQPPGHGYDPARRMVEKFDKVAEEVGR